MLYSKDGTNPVICRNPSSGSATVENYNNNGYATPSLLDSANPTLGISASSIIISGTNLICSFTRQNSNSNSQYYNLNTQSPYIIAAYGQITSGSTYSY